MRMFVAALIAAAVVAAPTSALAAKPVPDLSVQVSVLQPLGGTGCLYAIVAAWDGARIEGVSFQVWDTHAGNGGFVDGGGLLVQPRPTRAGSLAWTSEDPAVSGSVTIKAIFFDHRGFEVGSTTAATSCP